MSLYASILDFTQEGLPSAATASVSNQRLRALRAASTLADDYLRARYTLPIQAVVGEVEYIPASGSTGSGLITAALTSGATITQAYGVRVEILTTGASGVATARISITSGQTWLTTFTVVNGTVDLSIGVTLTFSDPNGLGWFDGDLYDVPVNFGSLTTHVVWLATWGLLMRRGFNPDMDPGSYDALKTQYKAAMAWLEGIRDNKIRADLTDSTGSAEEGLFLFEPEISEYEDADRDWTQVLGRTSEDE